MMYRTGDLLQKYTGIYKVCYQFLVLILAQDSRQSLLTYLLGELYNYVYLSLLDLSVLHRCIYI